LSDGDVEVSSTQSSQGGNSNTNIYEDQLNQLQEQLIASMIENQALCKPYSYT